MQTIKPDDKPKWKEFALHILNKMDEDGHFLNQLCFSDEETFYKSRKLTNIMQEFWGSENHY